MNQAARRPRIPGTRRQRRAAGFAVLLASLTTAGLGPVSTASSAPDESCPSAFPVKDLERGQDVTGKTVSEGTSPDSFRGEVLGVLENGIAPGRDMVLARLKSSEIDRVGGIWAGMSGSPVYADDGRLIGAVAWGLALGPSPVAGITPASDMYNLLTAKPARATAAAGDETVALPRSLRRELVRAGAATSSEAAGGLSRLPLPLGISGMINRKRLNQAGRALALDNVQLYKAGAVSRSGSPIPLEAGGNLAASLSYGDVSAVGVGTATAVCGDEILAFGHPMLFSGPTTLTLHGADAIYIQEDPTLTPFKVANAGPPMGAITQDRLAGILGREGAAPPSTAVRSLVEVPAEGASRRGSTNISVPDAVPDIAAFHLLANEDVVFDGISGGSSEVGWVVVGTREDGSTFRFKRDDRFANKRDISFEPVFELFDQLWRLQFNDIEEITIDRVRQTATMSRVFRAFKVAKVEIRSRGNWGELATDQPLVVRAGSTQRFRVTLTSSQLRTTRVRLEVPIPQGARNKFGFLEILGGNSFFGGGEGFFEEGGSTAGTASFEQLLKQIAREPRNDQVLAELNFFRNNGTVIHRSVREQVKAVVDGGVSVEVIAVR